MIDLRNNEIDDRDLWGICMNQQEIIQIRPVNERDADYLYTLMNCSSVSMF